MSDDAQWSSWDGKRYQLYVQMPLDQAEPEMIYNLRIIGLIRRQLLQRIRDQRAAIRQEVSDE